MKNPIGSTDGTPGSMGSTGSTRLTWHEYFANIALLASTRSTCSRLHVGCVIVRDNRILAMGYNGYFSGTPHIPMITDGHEQGTIHAEQNAVSHAAKIGTSLQGSVAYITHFPCSSCFKTLVSAGISNIYYIQDYRNDPITNQLSLRVSITIEKLHLQKMLCLESCFSK